MTRKLEDFRRVDVYAAIRLALIVAFVIWIV